MISEFFQWMALPKSSKITSLDNPEHALIAKKVIKQINDAKAVGWTEDILHTPVEKLTDVMPHVKSLLATQETHILYKIITVRKTHVDNGKTSEFKRILVQWKF